MWVSFEGLAKQMSNEKQLLSGEQTHSSRDFAGVLPPFRFLRMFSLTRTLNFDIVVSYAIP